MAVETPGCRVSTGGTDPRLGVPQPTGGAVQHVLKFVKKGRNLETIKTCNKKKNVHMEIKLKCNFLNAPIYIFVAFHLTVSIFIYCIFWMTKRKQTMKSTKNSHCVFSQETWKTR